MAVHWVIAFGWPGELSEAGHSVGALSCLLCDSHSAGYTCLSQGLWAATLGNVP